jgi:molybdenum cofactor cytidylyltransferase
MAKIAAVLLAAGQSSRFGADNKLLADLGGRPLVRGLAEEVLGGGADPVVTVTGCDRADIEAALAGLPVRFVHNEDWRAGMGSSVAAGVAALGEDVEATFIVPGDMPRLTSGLLQKLTTAFVQAPGPLIVYAATPAGEQRNPVLWPRRYFPKLVTLAGPGGAKGLLQRLAPECLPIVADDPTVFSDIDTAEDLEAVRNRAARLLTRH